MGLDAGQLKTLATLEDPFQDEPIHSKRKNAKKRQSDMINQFLDSYQAFYLMYQNDPMLAPTNLNFDIETQFTPEQCMKRFELLRYLNLQNNLQLPVLYRSPKILMRHNQPVKQRGSPFIGVSRNNSHSWQVMFKYNQKRIYLCVQDDLEQAALVHDIANLQIKGLEAKTNFTYNKLQLCSML